MTALKVNAIALGINICVLAFHVATDAPLQAFCITGAAIAVSSLFTVLSWRRGV